MLSNDCVCLIYRFHNWFGKIINGRKIYAVLERIMCLSFWTRGRGGRFLGRQENCDPYPKKWHCNKWFAFLSLLLWMVRHHVNDDVAQESGIGNVWVTDLLLLLFLLWFGYGQWYWTNHRQMMKMAMKCHDAFRCQGKLFSPTVILPRVIGLCIKSVRFVVNNIHFVKYCLKFTLLQVFWHMYRFANLINTQL